MKPVSRPRAPRLAAPQRGVLLLEALISILIFSFALLGLVALQARAVQYSIDAEDRNRASLLANELVAAMWLKQSANPADLTAEISAWQARLSDPSQGGLPGASPSITRQGGATIITLGWNARNRLTGEDVTRSYETRFEMPSAATAAADGGGEQPAGAEDPGA